MKQNAIHQSNCTTSPASPCGKVVAQIEQAKAATFSEFRQELGNQRHLLRLVINEAEALAWQTGYPHLLFPTLAEEKARAIANWDRHQRSLGRTSEQLAFAA